MTRNLSQPEPVDPPGGEQPKANANLSGVGTLWRLASSETGGDNPTISSSAVDSVPQSFKLSSYSVNIYEYPVRE